MKPTLLYSQTIKELGKCYDTHAEKFSSTRKKNRPEINHIINKLHEEKKTKLSILEL